MSHRVERERAALEESAAATREQQIARVVNKLGAEMAAKEAQWQAKADAVWAGDRT